MAWCLVKAQGQLYLYILPSPTKSFPASDASFFLLRFLILHLFAILLLTYVTLFLSYSFHFCHPNLLITPLLIISVYCIHPYPLSLCSSCRYNSMRLKVKVNLSLCFFLTDHHAIKAYWRSGGIAPRILELGSRWR
jgi:hypothetical protein